MITHRPIAVLRAAIMVQGRDVQSRGESQRLPREQRDGSRLPEARVNLLRSAQANDGSRPAPISRVPLLFRSSSGWIENARGLGSTVGIIRVLLNRRARVTRCNRAGACSHGGRGFGFKREDCVTGELAAQGLRCVIGGLVLIEYVYAGGSTRADSFP